MFKKIILLCFFFFVFFCFHFTMYLSSVSFSERICFVLYSLICFIWLMLSLCILKDFKQLFNIVSKCNRRIFEK